MPRQQDTDKALVRRLLEGDQAALQQFFDHMFARVYRFALARLDQRKEAAEDVAQATLVRAMRRIETWRGEASLYTWICTLCRHEIHTWREAHHEEAAVELIEDDPEVRAALESLHGHAWRTAEAAVERRELATLVQRLLDHLPPHYGNALEWKYLDELPVRTIAARLGLSEKATESLLTRARVAFRDVVMSVAPQLASPRYATAEPPQE
jgi:RNA polymerase sigma-70 factor (ECF subfamily)